MVGPFVAGLMRLSFFLQVRRPKGDTLEEMGKPLLFHDVEKKFGAPWNFYHRVDAHNSLKELANDPELPGKPAVIRLASQVVDLDCETGVLTLKDGTTIPKDLIVVADGQHVRASVHAKYLPPSLSS
jgi:2-polyprenyl-6-methoxyphenol hydroxylase-like FAD-dependent oxidoreductase